MSHIVYCVKLKKEAKALESAPYPGPLGEKILNSISEEAWQQWIDLQTMLINEHRLSLISPEARAFLKEEMVACVPGSGFGAEGFIRLSYATSMDAINEALDRLARFLEKLN